MNFRSFTVWVEIIVSRRSQQLSSDRIIVRFFFVKRRAVPWRSPGRFWVFQNIHSHWHCLWRCLINSACSIWLGAPNAPGKSYCCRARLKRYTFYCFLELGYHLGSFPLSAWVPCAIFLWTDSRSVVVFGVWLARVCELVQTDRYQSHRRFARARHETAAACARLIYLCVLHFAAVLMGFHHRKTLSGWTAAVRATFTSYSFWRREKLTPSASHFALLCIREVSAAAMPCAFQIMKNVAWRTMPARCARHWHISSTANESC